MNDASSSATDRPSHHHPESAPDSHPSFSGIAVQDGESLRQKRKLQWDQKITFLDHLIRNIDIVIYAQLSILYYMDCSLTWFLVRACPHWLFFTPKPAIFPPPPLAHRPFVGIIFGTNALCVLLHLLIAPPVAGEATRGYLHGGMLIDFVGQESPVGRWRLVGLDLMVLALQVLMLGVTLERIGASDAHAGVTSVNAGDRNSAQDHDAEERGLLRQDSTGEDIELQDLRHLSSGRTGGDEDRERDELLQLDGSCATQDQHPLDPFYTGERLIANLRILETVKAQWRVSGVRMAGAETPSTSSAQAAAVAAVAGRTLTYRLSQGAQNDD